MKHRHLWVAGTVAYILLVIATAPASLLDSVLRGASEGRLRLAEARGTLWSGAGQIEIFDVTRQMGMSKYFAWQVFPASLLRGRLVCMVELEAGAQRFPVTISPTRIEMANADVNLPAAMLGIAVPKLGPFGLGGDLRGHVSDLAIGRGGVQANAIVQWRAASSVHAPVSPLGDYELRVANSGTTTTATLITLAGPLQLDGGGIWANGANPAFKAVASIGPQYREQLEPFLRMIAVQRGAGNFDLQFQ